MWSVGVSNLPLNTQIKDFNDFLAATCGDQLRNVKCHLHRACGMAKLDGFESYDDAMTVKRLLDGM